MAEMVLSTLLESVFGHLTSTLLDEFRVLSGVSEELEKLKSTLTTILDVLQDAEERQVKSNSVRNWLLKLKDVAYDADDVLDEFTAEGLRLKVEAKTRTRKRKWCNPVTNSPLSFLGWNPNTFERNMRNKIKEITDRLDEIAKERHALHLREGDGGRRPEFKVRLQTSSLIDHSHVFGRDDDKKKLIEYLVPKESTEKGVSVIAIVGMGGLGKTTLAQLVYNDEAVVNHFELRMWVCVSDDFDVKRLTRSIFESASTTKNDLSNLDPLQCKLEKMLTGKRFLLVLDDVWNETRNDWDLIRVPFRNGAEGSRILVTTRSEIVARIMGTSYTHQLEGLPYDACLSLFKERAFLDENSDAYPVLLEIGNEIVKKCKGLPLAAKTLGGLLYSNTDANEWDNILKSEIWDLPEDKNDILPTLRLSYHHLPPNLKQCFAYCAVFPKDYMFQKDKLIELWIAQGFIQPTRSKQVEAIGSEYFDILMWRSFFQSSHNGHFEDMHTMHDLMHDLAKFIAGDECFIIESIESWRNHGKALRHSSFNCRVKDPLIFEACNKFKGLRTFLILGNIPNNIELLLLDVFLNLSSLRVLDLKGLRINKLPDSINNLKHLRYLDLSNNSIRRLPESTSNLYNLQILKLSGCVLLRELPNDMRNLMNLRRLDLPTETRIHSFPPGIGRLICLQSLSKFVVGSEGSGNGIGELKDLLNLRGAIHISHLERVRNGEEAEVANLKNKKYLRELTFQWELGSEDGQEVLESMQPHTNLEILRIEGYRGVYFPSWIGDSQFSCLGRITIVSCSGCKVLPPLGQLPLLNYLSMGYIYDLKHIGHEFVGRERGKGFPSLKILKLEGLCQMEERCGVEEGEFPGLHQVTIHKCNKLRQLPHLPELRELIITDCPKLIAVPRLPSLRILKLQNCDDKVLSSWVPYLTSLSSLTVERFQSLTSLPNEMLQHLVRLEELRIVKCQNLVYWPMEVGLHHLDSLKNLVIKYCDRLKSLPKGMRNLTALENLTIHYCPELNSLTEDGLPVRSERWSVPTI
ncbi:putative disease resistance protein RGA3 [Tasmannia lanceolata]|uniref:putative disease resistance protein RGA3 n=1 Tax=Tasmannia lanceolata TaxID=3420 RepID=UPI0040628361